MVFTRAWLNFKRMQDTAAIAACLIYAGAVLHAFEALPGGMAIKAQRTLIWPAMFLTLSLAIPLFVRPMRQALLKYVRMSFRAGFGQTPSSVLSGLGLLAGAAVFIYWQIAAAQHGGRYPAGVFSGYGAGIGILLAQAALVRALEQLPDVRRLIEERR